MVGTRRTAMRLFPALGAALALVLSACSSGGSASGSSLASTSAASAGSGSAQASSSPSASSSDSMADLVAEANNEGTLTWYSNYSADQVGLMVAAFNKKYPKIKVNALRMNAQDLAARVLTEQKAGKYNVDVVEGQDAYTGQLIQAGVFQPYRPPSAPPVPEGLDLPKGFQTVTYVTTIVIAYNPTVLKEKGLSVPTSFEDLTKPEWKGNFSVNPTDLAWYQSEIAALGHDKALQLAKALGDNSPRLVESHTQALTQVQSGEPAATAMAYGYKASTMKAKAPDRVAWTNPIPLPTGTDLINIVKKAPHPAAAKVFVDWIASADGQQAVVDVTNHTSMRTDVKNDTTVWDPSKWKPAWSDPMLTVDKFNSYAQELKAAFHAA